MGKPISTPQSSFTGFYTVCACEQTAKPKTSFLQAAIPRNIFILRTPFPIVYKKTRESSHLCKGTFSRLRHNCQLLLPSSASSCSVFIFFCSVFPSILFFFHIFLIIVIAAIITTAQIIRKMIFDTNQTAKFCNPT